ncbi:MAG TPA: hypothetical protein V6D09_07310 [Leptolyngbyaceae cyanobacterium]
MAIPVTLQRDRIQGARAAPAVVEYGDYECRNLLKLTPLCSCGNQLCLVRHC